MKIRGIAKKNTRNRAIRKFVSIICSNERKNRTTEDLKEVIIRLNFEEKKEGTMGQNDRRWKAITKIDGRFKCKIPITMWNRRMGKKSKPNINNMANLRSTEPFC